MKRLSIVTLALAGLLVCLPAAYGQQEDPSLREEIEALKKGQEEILRQLDQIQKGMRAAQRPAAPAGPDVKDKVFDLGSNPVKGSPSARLTLVEFTDYQ